MTCRGGRCAAASGVRGIRTAPAPPPSPCIAAVCTLQRHNTKRHERQQSKRHSGARAHKGPHHRPWEATQGQRVAPYVQGTTQWAKEKKATRPATKCYQQHMAGWHLDLRAKGCEGKPMLRQKEHLCWWHKPIPACQNLGGQCCKPGRSKCIAKVARITGTMQCPKLKKAVSSTVDSCQGWSTHPSMYIGMGPARPPSAVGGWCAICRSIAKPLKLPVTISCTHNCRSRCVCSVLHAR